MIKHYRIYGRVPGLVFSIGPEEIVTHFMERRSFGLVLRHTPPQMMLTPRFREIEIAFLFWKWRLALTLLTKY